MGFAQQDLALPEQESDVRNWDILLPHSGILFAKRSLFTEI